MNAREAGKKLLCGDFSQYTPTGASYFQKKNRWSRLPQVGSVQYNYIGSQGRIAHVAAVVDASIDYKNRVFTVKTIEGNTSAKTWENNGGMVAYKDYVNVPFDSVGKGTESHIEGFGSPLFDPDTCSVSDFIKALTGEVGYIEKASKKDMGKIYEAATEEEKVQNKGKNNFTKYGEWYGQNGVAWCQQFISWCAWYACCLHIDQNNNKWVKEGDDWYYYKNHNLLKGCWIYDDGRWYVVDNSGKMIRGWFKSNDLWYYLADDGGMLSSQWLEDKDKWYYFTSSGAMATNCYIYDVNKEKYCYVDKDGVWDGVYAQNPGPGAEVVQCGALYHN